MDSDRIQEFIDKSVQQSSNNIQCHPRFYVISGSNAYGFESDDSDIDIRGFHTVPSEEYSYLNDPDSEIRVNMGSNSDNKYNQYSDYELLSYELKRFGELLYKSNYDIIEQVLCSEVVMNGIPLEIDSLRSVIRNYLPLDIPESYYGMAKNQYYKHLDKNSDRYNPTPSSYLYVYRGFLSAIFVKENRRIEPNIISLASDIDIVDEENINQLVKLKKQNISQVDENMREQLHDEIMDMYSSIDVKSAGRKTQYKNEIDSWMREVR